MTRFTAIKHEKDAIKYIFYGNNKIVRIEIDALLTYIHHNWMISAYD